MGSVSLSLRLTYRTSNLSFLDCGAGYWYMLCRFRRLKQVKNTVIIIIVIIKDYLYSASLQVAVQLRNGAANALNIINHAMFVL